VRKLDRYTDTLLLYTDAGAIFLTAYVFSLLRFFRNLQIPNGVSEAAYLAVNLAKYTLVLVISLSFLVYGSYGLYHKEKKDPVAFFIPMIVVAFGAFVYFILQGLDYALLSPAEASSSGTAYWVFAHYIDPVYLLALVAGLLMCVALTRLRHGHPYLKMSYWAYGLLFPIFVYEIVIFGIEVPNKGTEIVEIVLKSLGFFLEAAVYVYSWLSLKEFEEDS
jgi:hypothetical protein